MELDDRKRLKKKENYCSLVEDVLFCAIKDELLERFILVIDEVIEIEHAKSKGYSAQIRRLVAILEKKPKPGVLHSFCEVLRHGGYSWIATAIEDTDTSEVPDVDLVDSTESSDIEKLLLLSQQIWIETQKNSIRLSNVELKLEQRRHPKNPASEEALKFPGYAVEGWDVVDAATSKRFVNKCIEEFIRKPRKSFSMIENVACRLGLEVTLSFSEVSLNEDVSKSDDEMVEYVATMRRVVKHVAAEHADILKECLDDLDMLEINGYRTVDLIADGLFQDDMNVNWGRIICWFAFWGQFAKYLHVSEVEKSEEFVKFYGEFIGFYLAKRLHLWIAGAGGWQTFVEIYKEAPTLLSRTLGILRLLFDYMYIPERP